MKEDFLRDYQRDAVSKMRNGCILNGGVGSGKSRTALYYYFEKNGGSFIFDKYTPMTNIQNLYIITTAQKRDRCEWELELANYRMSVNPELNTLYKNMIIVDSWNNIGKYVSIKDAFFIFDEDHVCGKGAWVKSFYKIAKQNEWIILSATPGDDWMDYVPVFIANGFYKNRTQFEYEHCIFSRYTKWKQVERWLNIPKLTRLRNKILVDMVFERHTIQHHETILCKYNIQMCNEVKNTRWDPFKNEPIQQASVMCGILRKIVNTDESRVNALLDVMETHDKVIIFYNFDYERDILLHVFSDDEFSNYEVAEWNGHAHQPVPSNDYWVYLVQYTAGCEGWNCILTDTIIFYSQTYSYKVLEQACGRIDRLNTPFRDLYYYHLRCASGIDKAISTTLRKKKQFNVRGYIKKW